MLRWITWTYLKSLAAIGIDVKNHDKFEEVDYSEDVDFKLLKNNEILLKNKKEYVLLTSKIREEYLELNLKEILQK